MKNYGSKKATEFTRKQINAIFINAKNGNLKVEKWFMNELYVLADYFGFDDNRTVEHQERSVKNILEAVFANNYEEAQNIINETADDWFNSYSRKNQAKCDRNIFVV